MSKSTVEEPARGEAGEAMSGGGTGAGRVHPDPVPQSHQQPDKAGKHTVWGWESTAKDPTRSKHRHPCPTFRDAHTDSPLTYSCR